MDGAPEKKTPTEEARQAYNTTGGLPTLPLSEAHRQTLLEGSAIAPDLLQEQEVHLQRRERRF